MAVKGTVKGDKDIIANIRRAQGAIGGPVIDEMSRHSLEPMRQQTEDNARRHRRPHTPPGGHLDEGVVIAKREQRGAYFKVFWVTFTKRARKIAHLVEFGTAPHYQPNRGIQHPGARPFPFMRPAFETTKQEVVETLAQQAWRRISGAIKR